MKQAEGRAKGAEPEAWRPVGGEAHFLPQQEERLDQLREDVSRQLAPKPKRLSHSLGVAREATHLALLYGVDPYLACAAGLLHDWSKVVPHQELVSRAQQLGIQMGVDLHLVEPLLHGKVAALELPERYPWLDPAVFQAIDRHTTGHAHMSPLDEVVFVADGIEPGRPSSAGIQASRDLVGRVSLDELYFQSFAGGVEYVIQTRRYLYPGTIDIYNSLVQARA
ncbi:MAG: bis(5'-nucleosyl)-tetraphosphatase (symmetrical) YqeK [Coriobacteriales bacterium]|nr:bis(5'-nucleosyl)-tetraphosphatase (symmetrical) YqeK [Coriobacteriales bacterium]